MALKLIRYTSASSLLDAGSAWGDLWQRSEVSSPAARAELIAHWLQKFAPHQRLQCLAVEDQGQLIAALPLVQRRLGRCIRVGSLPQNEWSPGGDLLLDSGADVDRTLDLLVHGLQQSIWPMLWFDTVDLDSARYQALFAAFRRANIDFDVHPRHQVGRVKTNGQWQDYQNTRSKNFRKKLSRAHKRAEHDGAVTMDTREEFLPGEPKELLHRAFEIENRSWKGRSRTSVLQTPGMFEFYARQAQVLAERDYLRLTFLKHNDREMAFEYGMFAKGVYHSFKVGYDDQFASYSPGRLLLYLILERMFSREDMHAADFMGPITPSMSSFVTSTYGLGRVAIAPRASLGRLLLNVYKFCWPTVRRLRGSVRLDRHLPSTQLLRTERD